MLKKFPFLERFAKHKHANGVKPAQLLERLDKVKKLAATLKSTSG